MRMVKELCAKRGCIKPAAVPQKYCSRDCSPFGHLSAPGVGGTYEDYKIARREEADQRRARKDALDHAKAENLRLANISETEALKLRTEGGRFERNKRLLAERKLNHALRVYENTRLRVQVEFTQHEVSKDLAALILKSLDDLETVLKT